MCVLASKATLPLYTYDVSISQKVTLADLAHLPYGSLLAVAGSDVMDSKPHVSRCVIYIARDSCSSV
jgi:hypothetical protein